MKSIISIATAISIIISLFFGISVFASEDIIFIPGDASSVALLSKAQPGDTFVIPDGTYENVSITLKCQGTVDSPITLKAQNPGKVIFTGETEINIQGKHCIVSDILFNESTNSKHDYLVYFAVGSSDSQLKNCVFINCNSHIINKDEKLDQVYIRGERHKVTSCYFRGKKSIGRFINIENVLNTDGTHTPGCHTIENCYFGDFKDYRTTDEFKDQGYVNGFEAIKIGSSDTSLYPSYSTVKGCFFEECNGEDELITTKSSNNTFLYNTFYNSSSALHLRCGNNSTVKGNVFINNIERIDVKLLRSTGIRIYGENHTVVDNYFYNQPENTGTIFIDSGTPNGDLSAYGPVKNINLSNNTLVAVDCGIVAGMYYDATNEKDRFIPPHGKVSNNAIISYKGTMPIIYNGDYNGYNHTLTFDNNYTYGKDLGYTGTVPSGINHQEFSYKIIDGFVIPKNGTGADINEIKKAPLNPFDIIPLWIKVQLYDSGEIAFNNTEDDIFNNKEANLNKHIPLSASIFSLDNDDKIKMYVNGEEISKKNVTVTGNPELKFTADSEDGKLPKWYINGVRLTPYNAPSYNISMETENDNEINVSNLINNYNITVEYYEKAKIPQVLDYGFSHISGNTENNPLTVTTANGETISIEGNYLVVFTRIPVIDGIEINNYGVKISQDPYTFKGKYQSIGTIKENGAFGMLFYNLKPDSTYYIKPYAEYVDSLGNITTVPGTIQNFLVK